MGSDEGEGGSVLQSDGDLMIQAKKDIQNIGKSIEAKRGLWLEAGNNIVNDQGTLKSGDVMSLTAGNSLINKSSQDGAQIAMIQVGSDLVVDVKQNIINTAAKIDVKRNAWMQAGNDIVLDGVSNTTVAQGGNKTTTKTNFIGSSIDVGGNLGM